MPNQIEDIWNGWKEPVAPCRGCPNFDDDRHFSPRFGGNKNADVVILADAPNKDRSKRNAADCGVKIDSDANREFDEMNYMDSIMNSNWALKYFLTHFCKDINISPRDLYLTNSKKCPDIGSEVWSESNTKARARCQTWLQSELDIIDPKVILMLGKPAVKAINWSFNLDIPVDPVKESFRTEKKWGISLVLGAHWSNHRFNTPEEYSGEGSVKRYRSDLAKVVMEHV